MYFQEWEREERLLGNGVPRVQGCLGDSHTSFVVVACLLFLRQGLMQPDRSPTHYTAELVSLLPPVCSTMPAATPGFCASHASSFSIQHIVGEGLRFVGRTKWEEYLESKRRQEADETKGIK